MEPVGLLDVYAYNNKTARHHAQRIHNNRNGYFSDTLLSQWGKSPVELYQTNVNLKYIVHHRLLSSCLACLNMAYEGGVWNFVDI